MTSEKSKAGGFSPAIVIGLLLVSVFSFAAFILLSAFEPELTSGSNGGAQALSQSAVGYAGAVRLLNAVGQHVSVGRTSNDLRRRQSFVILTPEQPLTWSDSHRRQRRDDFADLTEMGDGRGCNASRLGVACAGGAGRGGGEPPCRCGPRRTDCPRPRRQPAAAQHFGQRGAASWVDRSVANDLRRRVDARHRRRRRRCRPGARRSQSRPDTMSTCWPIRISSTPRASPTSTMPGRRSPCSSLLRKDSEPIVFDVTLNGLGAARNALRLAFQPPFLGFTLGFAIAGALLAWRAALRFGPNAPAQRAIALGKTALAENSAALIRLARREQRLGPGYARMMGALAGEKLGLARTGRSRDDAGARPHRRRPGAGELSYSQLAAHAGAAKNPQQMLDAARKLYAWKKEIARAAR